MNPILILQEEYYAYFKKELTGEKALNLFKNLPSSFNDAIIEANEEDFRLMVKQQIAYLGFSDKEVKKMQFKVLSEIVRALMIENNLSYRKLGEKIGLSERAVYDFVEYSNPLNTAHLQAILFEFGLALAPITNAEFAEKYLQVVEDTEPPTDEDLYGPKEEIPSTPLEPSVPNEEVPLIPLEPSTPVDKEEIPLTPIEPGDDVSEPVNPSDSNNETELTP